MDSPIQIVTRYYDFPEGVSESQLHMVGFTRPLCTNTPGEDPSYERVA